MGALRHFTHFLPRLLELTIYHRDGFLDLPVVFGKLTVARWLTWNEREQTAVCSFFDAYWDLLFAQPIEGTFDDSADSVLVAIANTEPSIFSTDLVTTDTATARRYLAAFVLFNDALPLLMQTGKLLNPLINPSSIQHGEIIDWIKSDELLAYLERAEPEEVLSGDFQYATRHVNGIRAALAQMS